MNNINININNIKKKIKEISRKKNISLTNLRIIAVTKNQATKKIKLAISSGLYEFGENYLQEGIIKIKKLKKYKNIVWHFIGKVQSKKSKIIAKYFDWCQTIDREKIAILLNKYRIKKNFPMNVLIQINISKNLNKNGICVKNYKKLAKVVSIMPNLNFRGIMIMPPVENKIINNNHYKQAKIIFNELKKKYKSVDTLSLGTSFDKDVALLHGSNMIRIGHCIFNKNNMQVL